MLFLQSGMDLTANKSKWMNNTKSQTLVLQVALGVNVFSVTYTPYSVFPKLIGTRHVFDNKV